METAINFSLVPFGYAICLNRGCVHAGTCLRQLIEPVVPADLQIRLLSAPNTWPRWRVIAPITGLLLKYVSQKGLLVFYKTCLINRCKRLLTL